MKKTNKGKADSDKKRGYEDCKANRKCEMIGSAEYYDGYNTRYQEEQIAGAKS